MKTYFQDNPFWKNEDKTEAMSIFVIEHDDGRIERKQQPVVKMINGKRNPLWTQLMEQIGPNKIDENTRIRKEEKARQHEENVLRQSGRDRSAELEHLFGLKLKAFEIKEIRESSDKKLRAKLRASKSELEMTAWMAAIFLKSVEEPSEEILWDVADEQAADGESESE